MNVKGVTHGQNQTVEQSFIKRKMKPKLFYSLGQDLCLPAKIRKNRGESEKFQQGRKKICFTPSHDNFQLNKYFTKLITTSVWK